MDMLEGERFVPSWTEAEGPKTSSKAITRKEKETLRAIV